MRVPLTVPDFIERAAGVYGDRVAVIDEPNQPAQSWGELPWARAPPLARASGVPLPERATPGS